MIDDLVKRMVALFERGQSYNSRLTETNRQRTHPPFERYDEEKASFDILLSLDARLTLSALEAQVAKVREQAARIETMRSALVKAELCLSLLRRHSYEPEYVTGVTNIARAALATKTPPAEG